MTEEKRHEHGKTSEKADQSRSMRPDKAATVPGAAPERDSHQKDKQQHDREEQPGKHIDSHKK